MLLLQGISIANLHNLFQDYIWLKVKFPFGVRIIFSFVMNKRLILNWITGQRSHLRSKNTSKWRHFLVLQLQKYSESSCGRRWNGYKVRKFFHVWVVVLSNGNCYKSWSESWLNQNFNHEEPIANAFFFSKSSVKGLFENWNLILLSYNSYSRICFKLILYNKLSLEYEKVNQIWIL